MNLDAQGCSFLPLQDAKIEAEEIE